MKKQRKCQSCKKVQDADLMHKITLEHKSGELFLNPDSKVLGRSAYVCKNEECINFLIKKRRLKGALKTNNTAQIEELLAHSIVKGQ